MFTVQGLAIALPHARDDSENGRAFCCDTVETATLTGASPLIGNGILVVSIGDVCDPAPVGTAW